MSEQSSIELLNIMNQMTDNETAIAKIDASIFVRNSKTMVDEKVAYLYNLMSIEAKNCHQRQDDYFDDVKLIITHFKQKLYMVYDELYCQYANIQNEIQEARTNKKIAIINFQKLINNNKTPLSDAEVEENKKELIKKGQIYDEIIEKCNLKFDETKEKFEKMINDEFLISSKSLKIMSEQNIFQRFIGKIASIFNGGKKYLEIVSEYNKIVNNIDSHEMVTQMREDIVQFVADIMEMRGFDEIELKENVRIGGKYGYK